MGLRECKAARCRHNLRTKLSEDMPGRPHDGHAPDWTIDGGHLEASAPSCVLDVVAMAGEGVPKSSREVAVLYNRMTTRRIEQVAFEFKKTHKALAMARLGEDG